MAETLEAPGNESLKMVFQSLRGSPRQHAPSSACCQATLGTRSGGLKPGLRGLIMRLPRLLLRGCCNHSLSTAVSEDVKPLSSHAVDRLLGLCTVLAYTLPFFGALLDVVAAVAGQAIVTWSLMSRSPDRR